MDLRTSLDSIALYIIKYKTNSTKGSALHKLIRAVTCILCAGNLFYNDYIPYILQLTQRILEYRDINKQNEQDFYFKIDSIPQLVGTCEDRYNNLMAYYA